MFLIDERENFISLQLFEIVSPELGISFINTFGARNDICKTPEYEDKSGKRPRENGKANPFHQFAEIVCGIYLIEKKTGWKVIVVVFVITSQVAYDSVRLHIYDHSSEKEDGADYELRRAEPRNRIVVFGAEEEKPEALHNCIAGVEKEACQYD